jgi:hypothetical protein
LENKNRLVNIKNRIENEKDQRWAQFKKAPGTQTSEKNSADKKGDDVAMAQSSKEEEAPNPKKTRVPFGLKKQEAARWLARRAMGITESRLAQELRKFQKQRNQHEMLVSVELTSPDTGKTRRVKALLDNGCTTTCIDWAYAKAENFELKELDQKIITRNADGSENTGGRITHYVELIMGVRMHRESIRLLVTGLGKARIFIGYDWLFKHNPEINWRDQVIKFSRCPSECNMKGTETSEGVQKEEALEEGESILMVDFTEQIDLRVKGTQAQQMAEEANREKEQMTEDAVPEQYREYIKVFAKESFDRLPEKRLWDHAIELKPDSKAVKRCA